MANDLNVVAITGRLTRDPELRATAGGTSVASMRVAVNGREKQGEQWADYANFLDVTVFGRQADSCEQYLEKGRRIAVSGRLRWREWEAKDGTKRQGVEIIANEVTFLGGPNEGDGAGARTRPMGSDMPTDQPVPPAPDDDDDVPF